MKVLLDVAGVLLLLGLLAVLKRCHYEERRKRKNREILRHIRKTLEEPEQ